MDNVSRKTAEITNYTRTDGYAWDSTNTERIEGEYYFYITASIKKYSVLLVTGHSWGSRYPLIAFYNTSNELVGVSGSETGEYKEQIVNVPLGADYCIVNGWSLSENGVHILYYLEADFDPDIPDSSITPSRHPYQPTGHFRYWAQKVLPTVYDDSLSYYEVLTKLVSQLNGVIDSLNEFSSDIDTTIAAFGTLQTFVNTTKNELIDTYDTLENFVNHYFDNLNVQDEINAKLDEMAESGELNSLIAPIIATTAPTIITNWLTENVDPVGSAVTVDSSLSISGSAADAKVTGDRFDNLNLKDILTGNDVAITNGTRTNNNAWDSTNNVNIPGDSYYYYTCSVTNHNVLIVSGRSWGSRYPLISFYDTSNLLVGIAGSTSQEYTNEIVDVPANANYCIVNGNTYAANNPVRVAYYENEPAYNFVMKSIYDVVNACDTNDVLMDANDAIINSIYRLYFRGYLEDIAVSNLPITRSRSTLGTLFTFGSSSGNAYRVQLFVSEKDGIYTRWSSSNGYANWEEIYSLTRGTYTIINDSDDVVQKWIDANNNIKIRDIYINAGNYDIIALYKRHYGNDYFDNYTGYDSGTYFMGRGLLLKNGKRYHFSERAIFTANYTGSNQNVTTYFSMFAGEYGLGFVADGLHITECNNLRYAVHIDFSESSNNNSGVAELDNCYITTNVRCVGAGLCNGGTLKLKDCVFIQNNDTVPVHVHTPNTSGEIGKLIVTGCYFSNRLQLGRGGSNEAVSSALISNNSYILFVKEPNAPYDIIQFNNYTHS